MIDLEPVREAAPPRRDVVDVVVTVAAWVALLAFGALVGFVFAEGGSL